MDDAPFDPARAVELDLRQGAIRLSDHAPRALVPMSSLLALLHSAGLDAARAFGHRLGEAATARIASRLGSPGAIAGASAEAVVTELGAELALLGLGSLSLERWGRAAVFAVAHAPAGAEARGHRNTEPAAPDQARDDREPRMPP